MNRTMVILRRVFLNRCCSSITITLSIFLLSVHSPSLCSSFSIPECRIHKHDHSSTRVRPAAFLLLEHPSRGGAGPDSSRQAWSYGARVDKKQQLTNSNSSSNNNMYYYSSGTTTTPPTTTDRPNAKYDSIEDSAIASTTTDDTKDFVDEFLSRDNRNSFIIRVYAILTVQLLITAGSVVFFSTHPLLAMRALSSPAVPLLSLLLSGVSVVWMSFSERARTTAPLKWNLLGIFTLSEAVVVGLFASLFPARMVGSAALATATATAAVTTYTWLNRNDRRDLSSTGRGLTSMLLLFLVYGLLSAFGVLPYNEALYSLAGAVMFSLYLAYHTKLIVSGKHSKYRMSHKDYVFGAMTLYSDIVNMFIYMLRILAAADDN